MQRSVISIKTCEMHCGGEPVRIVESGYDGIPITEDFLDAWRYVRVHSDSVRRALMWEPRGHGAMYGALLFPDPSAAPDRSRRRRRVAFMHHSGFSPMCGHATLALARYFGEKRYAAHVLPGFTEIDSISGSEIGLVSVSDSGSKSEFDTGSGSGFGSGYEIRLQLEVPCGSIDCWFDPARKTSRFLSVASFVEKRNFRLHLSDGREIILDVSFGGAYYAILSAGQAGVEFGTAPIERISKIGQEIKGELKKLLQISHPSNQDIAYVYGVIFTDDANLSNPVGAKSSINCVEFAAGQIDRSPCGSGVTARMALMFESGTVLVGEPVTFFSAVNNSKFIAKVVEQKIGLDGRRCVVVEVSGWAFYTGSCEFIIEPEDELGYGFDVK